MIKTVCKEYIFNAIFRINKLYNRKINKRQKYKNDNEFWNKTQWINKWDSLMIIKTMLTTMTYDTERILFWYFFYKRKNIYKTIINHKASSSNYGNGIIMNDNTVYNT